MPEIKNILQTILIHSFCPHNGAWLRKTNLISERMQQSKMDFLRPDQNFLSVCPFHLSGRNVTVGFRPVLPHILFLPKTGKISGYDTELTRVIADNFDMKLNFIQVKFGIYMKHNDSYSYGSANDMVSERNLIAPHSILAQNWANLRHRHLVDLGRDIYSKRTAYSFDDLQDEAN